MNLKRFIPVLLVPLLLCSCNEHKLDKFFSDKYLANHDTPGLARPSGDILLYENIFGHEVYVKSDLTQYTAYVNQVYSYLVGQGYAVLGTSSKTTNLTRYHFKGATLLPDFNTGSRYVFIFSKDKETELNDDNQVTLKNYRCLTISNFNSEVQTHTWGDEENPNKFEYNYYIQFHTSISVIMPSSN